MYSRTRLAMIMNEPLLDKIIELAFSISPFTKGSEVKSRSSPKRRIKIAAIAM